MDSQTKTITIKETETEAKPASTVINMPTEEVYKAYKYRYVVLFVYVLLSMNIDITTTVTGPILTTLQDMYNVSLFMVTLCMFLIQYMIYVPAGFLANWVLDKYGLRTGILCGCFFLLLGAWVNVLSEHGFYILFIGNVLESIGQPFIFNTPQIVSSNWFLPRERAMSTAIGSMANPIGSAIGYSISTLFVSDGATGATGLRQFKNLMRFCAILATATVALNALLLKSHPPTPPSKSSKTAKLSTTESLKSISKNWNYIIFAVSASLTWGSVNFFGSMLQPMVYPFNYTDSQAGVLSAITIGSGVVGSFVWAAYVDKTKKFKRSIIICSVLTIGFTVFLGAGLFIQKFPITAVATACMGFFAMPTLSLGFELCAELSFPAAEGTAGGLFVLTSNLVSVFGILAADALLKNETKPETMYVLIIIVGIQVVALIGFIIFKEDLRRLKADKAAKDETEKLAIEGENKSEEELKKSLAILSNSHIHIPKEVVEINLAKSLSCHI